jgi:hypothetical protein
MKFDHRQAWPLIGDAAGWFFTSALTLDKLLALAVHGTGALQVA